MKVAAYAIRKTLQHYANSGYLLIATALLAFVAANTAFSEAYFSMWEKNIYFRIGDFDILTHHGVPMTVMQFINDALMAVFFFAVGLEIKREVLVGELSSFKKAALPVIGALGGVIIPITVYSLIAEGAEQMQGAAIPMATDIAFSLGILSLFGRRVPIGLKIFLATLAVADDLIGITVIAVFYTDSLYPEYLVYAAVLFAVMIAGMRFRVSSKMFYIIMGTGVWFLFLNSGIHPTIAGVLTAFCVPARPQMKTSRFINEIKEVLAEFPASDGHRKGKNRILSPEQMNMLKNVESASDKVISPLQDLEDSLHPLVNYLIIPLFAFANAGVSLDGITLQNLATGVTPAVAAGLFVGKFAGILSFSTIAIRMKISEMPQGVTWRSLAGVSALGGIGFTVSFFISSLAFGEEHARLLSDAKLGIIAGSLLSGLAGWIILKKTLPEIAGEDTPE